MQYTLKAVILFSIYTAFYCGSAQAAILNTYVDKALFQSETGATSATGTLPDLGEIGANFVVLGDITLYEAAGSTKIFVGALGTANAPDWTDRTTGNDIALSGNEDFDVSLATPATSFGFDVVEPDGSFGPGGFSDNSVFEISLFSGGAFGTLIGSDQFTLWGSVFNNDLVEFIGVTADSAFDFIKVREVVSNGNTNDYFGEFYTTAAIPIPASWWLFGSALLGLIGLKRKA